MRSQAVPDISGTYISKEGAIRVKIQSTTASNIWEIYWFESRGPESTQHDYHPYEYMVDWIAKGGWRKIS